MSDATRLRGDGEAIQFADGEVVELRFDFDALCELEETFGSLSEFVRQLNLGGSAKIMQTAAGGIAAALRHLSEPPSVSDVRRRLDSRLINDYAEALNDAFAAAMPSPSEGKDSEETNGSPGISTTTSQPFASVVATPNSGE